MSFMALSRYFGFYEQYLNQRKLKDRLPQADKIIQMREIFTDNELFEILVECEGNSYSVDSFVMSLNVSKEVIEKNRIRRKIQRGVKNG